MKCSTAVDAGSIFFFFLLQLFSTNVLVMLKKKNSLYFLAKHHSIKAWHIFSFWQVHCIQERAFWYNNIKIMIWYCRGTQARKHQQGGKKHIKTTLRIKEMSTESLQMVFILLQFSLSSPQKMTASDLYLPAAYHPQSDPFAFSVLKKTIEAILIRD